MYVFRDEFDHFKEKIAKIIQILIRPGLKIPDRLDADPQHW